MTRWLARVAASRIGFRFGLAYWRAADWLDEHVPGFNEGCAEAYDRHIRSEHEES